MTHDAAPRQARTLRLAALALAVALAGASWVLGTLVGLRGQAAAGALCLIALVAACSDDLRRVNWRTVLWGIALQVGFALAILKLEVAGRRPGYEFFAAIAAGVGKFLEFTTAGSTFVFGVLANQGRMGEIFGPDNGFVFAFTALPTIVFVSSFFTVLYYFGVLQVVVRLMARAMMVLMRTSGAETLSAAANVFMGQTEAPIIVKPFVPRMTQSELLAMMVGGMATIAGGVMAVYIALGADPIAILTTSVMAAPCGLYLSKLMLPEREQPETIGTAPIVVEKRHVNVVDAAASGASDGMVLAINVAAMLIAFLAFLALVDFVLGAVWEGLTLARVFAVVFAPVAFLMGIPAADVGPMADLLGTKLVANEFVAFVKLTTEYRGVLSDRSYVLATYALTGFANIASIGIQLGGIGGMAPTRRGDLARLGGRALLGGFVATVINGCVAAVLI
ncbi:MAG TPA: nucleoside transporter C-terminal domain-containing protein [Vicinamibacterales bacterium]|nr:nucleoside transporter C-terminal domain-containing protein [Vicinamibacterales bacterium]